MTKQRCLTRLKRSILPVLCLVFILFGYGPAELYLSNRGSEEMWFSFNEILLPAVILIVASLLVIIGLLMILPTKGYQAAMAVITAVEILLLLQALFLPNDYGSLNGTQIDWSQYIGRLIYNTAIWIGIIVGAIIWAFRNWKGFREAMQFSAVMLIVLQVVILVTTGITRAEGPKETTSEEVYLTTEKLYTVSSERNTIVFILDAFDSQLMCDLLEEYPDEIRTSFEDFTFYHNTNGGATRTKYAIPFILTGKTNNTGGTYNEYLREGFQDSVLFQELRTGKYSTGFYTEYGYVDRAQTQAIDNLSSGGKMLATSRWGLSLDVMKMAAFKYAPHALKPIFWMYSFELAQWRGGNGDQNETPYHMNDIQFYQTLREIGLDTKNNQTAFRFIHLKGAHGPFTMDENMQSVSHENGSARKQGLGALRIVAEYIQQLKSLSLFENANIFVLADHGDNEYIKPNIEQNPLFMVKEAGSKKPFSISEARLSYKDIPSMLVDALQNRLCIDSKYETQGTRYFYVGSESNNSYRIIEYASDGNAYDTDSYHATGNDYINTSSDMTYELGTELYFGENGGSTAKKYCVKGFTYPETSYVWTNGKEIELRFDIGLVEQNLELSIDYGAVNNNYQRVYVYAGEQPVASFVAKNASRQSFILPKEAVQDGILDIKIMLPDAFSPLKEGTGVDGRMLGLALRSVMISQRDLLFEKEKQMKIREYRLGQEITFGEDGNMDDYDITGVSRDKWTFRKTVTICFDEIKAETELALLMEYNTYGDQQHVIVNANKETIADYMATGNEKKELVIPKTLLNNGTLVLEINLPDAERPGNGDQRELGLWMKRIMLHEAAFEIAK